MTDREVHEKLLQLRTYIPFVERMIKKLEPTDGPEKNDYLIKLRGLHGFLTSTPDARRISYETLLKMEKIIKGMYETSAGRNVNTSSNPKQFERNTGNREPSTSFIGRSSSNMEQSHSSQYSFHRRSEQYDSYGGRIPAKQDQDFTDRRSVQDYDFCGRRNVSDVDYRSNVEPQYLDSSGNFGTVPRNVNVFSKKKSYENDVKKLCKDSSSAREYADSRYTSDFDERHSYHRKRYDNRLPNKKIHEIVNYDSRNEASSSNSSKYSDDDYIRRERELFGEDIFGESRSKRLPKPEPKKTLLDLPMPPVKPFNPKEYMSSKQSPRSMPENKVSNFSKSSNSPDSDNCKTIRNKNVYGYKEFGKDKIKNTDNKNIPESHLDSTYKQFPESTNAEWCETGNPNHKNLSSILTTDTPQSPEIEATFSPIQNEDELAVKSIPLEKSPISNVSYVPKNSNMMDNIKNALDFLAVKPKVESLSKTTLRYEDFVGPAGRRISHIPSNPIENSDTNKLIIFGKQDMDLRKADTDLRQLPKPLHVIPNDKSGAVSKWSNCPSKDVDMRSFCQQKVTSISISKETRNYDLAPSISKESVRSRLSRDSEKVIKLGNKSGVAVSQLESFKLKREKLISCKTGELQSKSPKLVSLLDELLPISEEEQNKSEIVKSSITKSNFSQHIQENKLSQSKKNTSAITTNKSEDTSSITNMSKFKSFPKVTSEINPKKIDEVTDKKTVSKDLRQTKLSKVEKNYNQSLKTDLSVNKTNLNATKDENTSKLKYLKTFSKIEPGQIGKELENEKTDSEQRGQNSQIQNTEREHTDSNPGSKNKEPDKTGKYLQSKIKESEKSGRYPQSKESDKLCKNLQSKSKELEKTERYPQSKNKTPELGGRDQRNKNKEPEKTGKNPHSQNNETEEIWKNPQNQNKESERKVKDPRIQIKEPEKTSRDPINQNRDLEKTRKDPRSQKNEPEMTWRDPRSQNKEPEQTGRDPRSQNKVPEQTGRDPRSQNKEPEHTGRDPRSQNKEPEQTGRDPRSQNKESEQTGRDPRSQNKDIKQNLENPRWLNKDIAREENYLSPRMDNITPNIPTLFSIRPYPMQQADMKYPHTPFTKPVHHPLLRNPTMIRPPPFNGQPMIRNPLINTQVMIRNPPMIRNSLINTQPLIRNPPINTQPMIRNPSINIQPMVRNPSINCQPMIRNPSISTQPTVHFPQSSKTTAISDSFTCVILKGLPPYVTSRNLYRFFEHYLLRDLCIVLSNSLNCKGEAYVHFACHKDAEDALNTLNGNYIDNYRIFVGVCAVGILKQAKRVYGIQNLERERLLKIEQKPANLNWNPFYKAKPRPVELPKPPDVQEPQAYSSPIDRPSFNTEVNSKGYSNMCGVKLSNQSKDIKKFKIPKVKKINETVTEEKIEPIKISEKERDIKSNSSSDELDDIILASKKNRRFRKIKQLIDSDTGSDDNSIICNETESEKETTAKLVVPIKKKMTKPKKLKQTDQVKTKIKKTQSKASATTLRRGRSQLENESAEKSVAQKITRQIEDIDEAEVTVIIPVPEKIMSEVPCNKSFKFITAKKGNKNMHSSSKNCIDESVSHTSDDVESGISVSYRNFVISLGKSNIKQKLKKKKKTKLSLTPKFITSDEEKSVTKVEKFTELSSEIETQNFSGHDTDSDNERLIIASTDTKSKTSKKDNLGSSNISSKPIYDTFSSNEIIELDSSSNTSSSKFQSFNSEFDTKSDISKGSFTGSQNTESKCENTSHLLTETKPENISNKDTDMKSNNSIDKITETKLDNKIIVNKSETVNDDTIGEIKSQNIGDKIDETLSENIGDKITETKSVTFRNQVISNKSIEITQSKSECISSEVTGKSINYKIPVLNTESTCTKSTEIKSASASKHLTEHKLESMSSPVIEHKSQCAANNIRTGNKSLSDSIEITEQKSLNLNSKILEQNSQSLSISVTGEKPQNLSVEFTDNKFQESRVDKSPSRQVNVPNAGEFPKSEINESICVDSESYFANLTEPDTRHSLNVMINKERRSTDIISNTATNVDVVSTSDMTINSNSEVTQSKHCIFNNQEQPLSIDVIQYSSEKSLFDKDDDFDLPDLTQITPTISNDLEICESDIAELSGLDKDAFIRDEKSELSEKQAIEKIDIDNINEINNQLVKSANEFTRNQSIDLSGDSLVNVIDSDEENDFTETVDAIVDSLSKTLSPEESKSTLSEKILTKNDRPSELEENQIKLNNSNSSDISNNNENNMNCERSNVLIKLQDKNLSISDSSLIQQSQTKKSAENVYDSLIDGATAESTNYTVEVNKSTSLKKTKTSENDTHETVKEEDVANTELENKKVISANVKLTKHDDQWSIEEKRITRSSKNVVDNLEVPSNLKLIEYDDQNIENPVSIKSKNLDQIEITSSDIDLTKPADQTFKEEKRLTRNKKSAQLEITSTDINIAQNTDQLCKEERRMTRSGKNLEQLEQSSKDVKIAQNTDQLCKEERRMTRSGKDLEQLEQSSSKLKLTAPSDQSYMEDKRKTRSGKNVDHLESTSFVEKLKTGEEKCKSKNSKNPLDQLETSCYPKIILRSPTLLLKDIVMDSPPTEISDDDVSFDNESGGIADDDSTVSGDGRISSQNSPLPTATSRKAKRERKFAINRKKRITRGSMVIPEIKESILWDDGGVVDLFLCDQCDYVGKLQVFHLINFHGEREIPCVFRKEDFGPLLRDFVGPPDKIENSEFLDISWIPTQMTFDEEIECQENDCDYYSSSRFDFLYHLLEHNPESINTFFHCRLCNYMTNDLILFYDHVTSHTGEYRHTCIRCGQRFFSMEALKLHHSENHSNIAEEFSIIEPILEDGWPYIYVCKQCQYAQISKENCGEHVQKKHNGKADIKKANMTRHVNVWQEKKKENENEVKIPSKSESASLESPNVSAESGSGTLESSSVSVKPKSISSEYSSVPVKSPTVSSEPSNVSVKSQIICAESSNVTVKSQIICAESSCGSIKSQNLSSGSTATELDSLSVESRAPIPNTTPKMEIPKVKSSPPIICDQSVFFGNSKKNEINENLPPVIASNLIERVPLVKPKLMLSLLDDILKKIEVEPKDKKKHFSDIDIENEKNMVNESPTNLEVDPLSSTNNIVDDMVTAPQAQSDQPTIPSPPTETTRLRDIKRPFSALNESHFLSPSRRQESSDYDSDQLIIDEDREADVVQKTSFQLEINDHEISSPEQSTAKFMKRSEGERAKVTSIDNNPNNAAIDGDNDQGGFLHIESCMTVDPKAASKIFSDNGQEQSIGDPISKTASSEGRSHSISPFPISDSNHENPQSKIPGADILPESGPTVPLLHLFCRYQTAKSFIAYTSSLAPKVFKCMTHGCLYGTNVAAEFESHLAQHVYSSQNCELRCCYCLFSQITFTALIQHILLEHSHCSLQCKYCLYRAHSKVYIGVHLKKFHPNNESRFMKVNTIRTVLPPCPPIENFVYPYKCSFSECFFKTVDSECFNNHVRMHGPNVQLSCYLCKLTTTGLDLVEHMKVHMMNEYQCPYCLFGVEERERLLTHLLNRHPGRQGRVLLRKQESSSFPSIKPENVPPSRTVSTDSEATILPSPIQMSRSPSLVPSSSPSYTDNLSDSSGLTGNLLYRCGNEKCSQSCQTQALLKEHLQICDFSRDSPLLKCFHCLKTFRQLSGLIEHIKVHGPKRYSCGVTDCDYRGNLPHYFKNHMKQAHQSNSYKIVQKDFTNKDPETQEFIVYKKETFVNIKEPHKKKKNEYSTEDIEKIPRSHICYNDLKCYHCPYITKIRLNLIKHLYLHKRLPTLNLLTENESVPVKQPVNPVPRLDRKELMFDKMMNLAGSSYNQYKDFELNEMRNKNVIPDEELKDIPVYVPDETINTCGIDECKYVSCGEVMLKYHINTLHGYTESWLCPHCPNFKLTVDKMSAHFKLHGPRLYRCGWCSYLSIKQSLVDRHLKDKHPTKKLFTFTIRSVPTDDAKEEDAVDTNEKEEADGMLWQCGLCVFRSVTQQEMVNHTTLKHDLKSQYKCGYCSVRSSVKTAFDNHFATKHPNKDFRVLCIFYRLDSDDIVPVDPSGKSVGHEPLWRRNDPDRPKQIRGILIDDKSDKELSLLDIEPGEPNKNEFVCPKCHSFKTPCVNTFRLHLCKEANYQRFECAECGISSPLLPTIRRHYTRTHGASFISDCYVKLPVESHLEAWVESIIMHQTQMIVKWVDGDDASKPIKKIEASPSTSSRRSSYEIPQDEAGTSEKVLHSSGLKFGCDLCGLQCKTQTGLKSHKTVMHQMKFKCQYCPFNSNLEVAVIQHSSAKHPTLKANVLNMINEENKESSPRKVKSTPKPKFKKSYTCSTCNLVLHCYKIFLKHKKKHFKKKFYCQYCNKQFKTKKFALHHNNIRHPDKPPEIMSFVNDAFTETLVEEEKIQVEEQPEEDVTASEYSCCHCGENGSNLTIEEHMKVNHRELPYLVRRKSSSGLYLEVNRFTCGHCNLENVTLLEAMNHWLKSHVALDFAFKVTLFSSSLIPPSSPQDGKQNENKSAKRKLTSDSPPIDNPIRKKRPGKKSRLPKEAKPYIKSDISEDIGTNQVSSSTTDATVDMVIKCGYCPLTFTSNSVTVKHIKQIHGESKSIKMQMLEKDEYEKSHKGFFECNYCGETGAIDEIHNHALEAHPDSVASFKKISKAASIPVVQKYKCNLCNHIVRTKRAMQVHIIKKHEGHSPADDFSVTSSETDSQLNIAEETPSNDSDLTCGYCNEVVETMIELQDHHAFLHSHLPVKYNLLDSERVPKKNTARKSFATAGKRQFATKSTSARVQMQQKQEILQSDPLSSAEVYVDYAEIDDGYEHM